MATLSARLLTFATLASLSCSSSASSTSASTSEASASKKSQRRPPSAVAVVCALLLLLGAPVLGYAQNAGLADPQATTASQLSSPQAKAHRDHGAAHCSLSILPAAGQGPISAALGRDDSRYWLYATAGSFHAENPQHALAANFTRQGVEIRSNAARWGISLRGYGYGDALVAVRQVAPQAHANRVEYGRGVLTEWYINGPLGLEQGFTLAKSPGKANGRPLTIAVALSGNLTAAMDAGGSALTLRQRNGKAALRVASLMAYDATGRELQGRFALRGGELLLQVDDAGAQYPLVLDPLVQQAELSASDGAADDHFGYSVALSDNGGTALVGAPYHTVNGNTNQGAAYVFTLSAGTWTQQQELTALDGAFGDYFGASVALSSDGTTALVGAIVHTVNGNNQGAAYVFTLSAGSWTQQQELTASDGAAGDSFGDSVALAGDATALVGAFAHNNQGAAYVFMLSSGSWTQQQELTALDGAAGDSFGDSVALASAGTTALVGAPYHAVTENTYQGAAYVFTLSGSSWTQQSELTALDGAADDLFGSSVALANAGSTALVGAPLATVNGSSYQGAAYVFTLSGSSWTQQQELTAGGADEGFGDSVALASTGTVALVGAPLSTINGMSYQGAAYAFTLSAGNWALQQELTAADGTANDYFANSVALSSNGTMALLGALDHAVNGNSSQGAAYVWNTPYSQLTASPASLNFPNTGETGSSKKQLYLENAGPTKVVIGTVSITPISGNPTAFSFHQYCNPTLRAGHRCVIAVTFRPQGAGLDTATLNIPSSAIGSPLEVPLSGTGVVK